MGVNVSKVGDRLRSIRSQQGMSLSEVERRSEGQFKASVMGAYERGERALSISRLADLAEFYGVPITQMIPHSGSTPAASSPVARFTLDLTKIDGIDGDGIIERFLKAIQLQRQDFNGKVLSVRYSDVQMLAAVLDATEDELTERLGVSSAF